MDFNISFRIKNTTANSLLGSFPSSSEINIVFNYPIYRRVSQQRDSFFCITKVFTVQN